MEQAPSHTNHHQPSLSGDTLISSDGSSGVNIHDHGQTKPLVMLFGKSNSPSEQHSTTEQPQTIMSSLQNIQTVQTAPVSKQAEKESVVIPTSSNIIKGRVAGLCEVPNCGKLSRGSSKRCITHGGGKKCTFQGCQKSSRAGGHCKQHGGGRRCAHESCNKSAQGATLFCKQHGGGKRCEHPDCKKSAEGPTNLCIAHGGGFRCEYPDCTKSARGKTKYCIAHGGGLRCTVEGCDKGARSVQGFCKMHSKKRTLEQTASAYASNSNAANAAAANAMMVGGGNSHGLNITMAIPALQQLQLQNMRQQLSGGGGGSNSGMPPSLNGIVVTTTEDHVQSDHPSSQVQIPLPQLHHLQQQLQQQQHQQQQHHQQQQQHEQQQREQHSLMNMSVGQMPVMMNHSQDLAAISQDNIPSNTATAEPAAEPVSEEVLQEVSARATSSLDANEEDEPPAQDKRLKIESTQGGTFEV